MGLSILEVAFSLILVKQEVMGPFEPLHTVKWGISGGRYRTKEASPTTHSTKSKYHQGGYRPFPETDA